MRIFYRHWLFKLPLARKYRGMVLGRNILFKGTESDITPELLKHEMIHQEQMDRHGVMAFYTIYLKDYLYNLARFRNHDKAYWNIPFEIEARDRQNEA